MSVIKIKDRGEVLTLQFSELRNYHGNLALMAIGVGFRVVQAALAELYTDEVPERSSLSVRSGHAGPGFRDAFEYTTRAVTRGAYTVDVNYPAAQYDPYRPQSYAYVISDLQGASVEVSLKPNFLPAVFYEYLKKGREGTMTEEDKAANEQLKADLCKKALSLPQSELLEVKRLS
ncbi:FmdE family protein [Paenibacillus sp. FSL H8-0034]|uniref:FmdE family protein n=1 Tax=Paenibacillus sp. FSL H8-0034 TaxID=2954671 RepID=UPI0030F68755